MLITALFTGEPAQITEIGTLRRVWIVLRMKEHLVSKMLKERVQDEKIGTLQQAAFEQVPLLPTSHILMSTLLCAA